MAQKLLLYQNNHFARLRLDAGLYDFPPPNQPGKRGQKPKKGKRQPALAERIKDSAADWLTIKIRWYDGIERTLEILSGVSLWYTPGKIPVAIKWVVVRDPEGNLRTEAFFSTDINSTLAIFTISGSVAYLF